MYIFLKSSNFSNFSIFNAISLIYKGYKHFDTYVQIPYNKYTVSLLELLLRNNCISGYRIVSMLNSKLQFTSLVLEVKLLYLQNLPAVYNMQFISTPSRRRYITLRQLKSYVYQNRQSVPILSTNLGLLIGEEAITAKVGGEIICILN